MPTEMDAVITRWILLLLPLCLILQDRQDPIEEPSAQTESDDVAVAAPQIKLQGTDLLRQQLLAGFAVTAPQAFPGSIPWGGMRDIGSNGLYPVDSLLHYHPTLFLEMCLERYKRDVTGYSTKLIKRELLSGKLEALEKIEVHCREHPFSVYMNWLEGGEGVMKPQRVLYVAGENNGKLLARGRGVLLASLGVFSKDIHSAEARRGGRYTIDESGIYQGMQRTLDNMLKAQERGALHVAYYGTFKVPELNNRVCYKFIRTPYEPLEEEGLNELTVYIDQESWIQIGSVLRDTHGNLIAEYYFRDLKINPEFKKDQFTRAGM